MNVLLGDHFQTSPRWARIAASVSAALREARLGAWHVTLNPVSADSGDATRRLNPPDDECRLVIRVDVADMSLEASLPDDEMPLEDDELGRMLVAYIQEAEDETASEYGPTDEDDFPDLSA